MIQSLKDIIQACLEDDFWRNDSFLVEAYYAHYGKQLTCEEFCVYPSSMDDNVMYVDIGEDSVHRFKITIEEES